MVSIVCMWLCAVAISRAETTLQVLDAYPASPAVLGKYENLSLRIGYTCDLPIFVRGEPLLNGERVSGMNGGSPLYKPGSGEAFFWLAANNAAKVDSIVITASDRSGKTVAQITFPVDLSWKAERNENPPPAPEWVERMKGEQNNLIASQAAATTSGPAGWLMMGLGSAIMLCVPAYFILQILLLWRLRDSWRKAAAAPLVPMGLVLLYTIYAYHDGSNLFPIILIFASPVAVGYLTFVAVRWRTSRRTA